MTGVKGVTGESRGEERGLGGEHVEGRNAVRELLRANRRRVPHEIWLAAGRDSDTIDEIIELARSARVTVRPVTADELKEHALGPMHLRALLRVPTR